MAGQSAILVFLLSVSLWTSAGLVDGARSSGLFSGALPQLRRDQGLDNLSHYRKLTALVVENPLILPYHSGPILSGDSGIRVYLVWYGTFSESQRSTVVDFFSSFAEWDATLPTVSSWWKTTSAYKDAHGASVMSDVHLAGQTLDDYSKGKFLRETDLHELVEGSLTSFPADSKSVYFVLTADDVLVESFCMNSCGSHYFTAPSMVTKWQQLPYAWVGNSASQCAGRCAWPYAKPVYGPQTEPLVAPNGDVGVDGMIINIASLLAGIATDPYTNAFYQGDASAPLEAATACAGIYGEGAYPGHPGSLLVDEKSGASYNTVGSNDRKFLLPSLWDPSTLSCRSPFSPQIEVETNGLLNMQLQ